MRTFVFGELWGPFQCEHPNCNKSTFDVELTDQEHNSLIEKSGPIAASQITSNKLGKAVCVEHSSKSLQTITN